MRVPHGLLQSVSIPAGQLWLHANERLLGIKTEPGHYQVWKEQGASGWQNTSRIRAENRDESPYASINYWNLRRVIRALEPGPGDVFYDIGAGMGRVVCVMAQRQLRKCVGIEIFEALCDIARSNAATLRGRRSPIEIICEDAATADLSDGTLFYMFHPFGEKTMQKTLENLRQSVLMNPRTIKIAYCVPVYASLFQNSGWLEQFHELHLLGGHKVAFWRTLS